MTRMRVADAHNPADERVMLTRLPFCASRRRVDAVIALLRYAYMLMRERAFFYAICCRRLGVA